MLLSKKQYNKEIGYRVKHKLQCTMLTAILPLLSVLLSVARLAWGHGYVQEITLGSTKYTGYLPYSDP